MSNVLIRFQAITDSPNCGYQIRLLQLLTDGSNMDIDVTIDNECMLANRLAKQIVPGENTAGILRQASQNFEFGNR